MIRGEAIRLPQLMIIAALLLIAATAIRDAVVQSWALERPELAAAVWPHHPNVLLSSALSEIGSAAAQGRTPPQSTLAQVAAAARRAPLAAEPMLIAGTRELSFDRLGKAEALLREARHRDPRSLAARVLLIDLHLRQGRMNEGLEEIGSLSRLLPGGPSPAVQLLAAYARDPVSSQPLAALFGRRPDLLDPVLSTLASDPQMADRVLTLAGRSPGGRRWQAVLVDALARSSRYAEARKTWATFTGDKTAADHIVNNEFEPRATSIAPFDWTYQQGGGMAEPTPNGLRALSYGRGEARLASQSMTLSPGTYRLTFRLNEAGGAPSGLFWAVACVPLERELLRMPLPPRPAVASSLLEVPPDCPAQRLWLSSADNGSGQPTTAKITSISLDKVAR